MSVRVRAYNAPAQAFTNSPFQLLAMTLFLPQVSNFLLAKSKMDNLLMCYENQAFPRLPNR